MRLLRRLRAALFGWLTGQTRTPMPLVHQGGIVGWNGNDSGMIYECDPDEVLVYIPPAKVTVTNMDGTIVYEEGRDYEVIGDTIHVLDGRLKPGDDIVISH